MKAKVIFETNENGNIEIKNSAHLTMLIGQKMWMMILGLCVRALMDCQS